MQVWHIADVPPNDKFQYTHFAHKLNSFDTAPTKLLASDSRLRPDRYALEMGDLSKSGTEKSRFISFVPFLSPCAQKYIFEHCLSNVYIKFCNSLTCSMLHSITILFVEITWPRWVVVPSGWVGVLLGPVFQKMRLRSLECGWLNSREKKCATRQAVIILLCCYHSIRRYGSTLVRVIVVNLHSNCLNPYYVDIL
jgi:hypothetical protein